MIFIFSLIWCYMYMTPDIFSYFSQSMQTGYNFEIRIIFQDQDIHRGSYMSAHVLLNLLNELGKRDKMRGLPSILSFFRNEFNKFNNTRARMLDSIYHMIKSHFCRKNVIILSLFTQHCYGRHNVSRKSINH